MPKNPELLDQVRGYSFWREGCSTFIANICDALRLAEIEVEPRNVIRFAGDIELFIESAMKSEKCQGCYCDQCFRIGFELTAGKESRRRHEELMRYFLGYLNDRTWVARTMLVDSAIGTVSGLGEITISKKG